MGDISCFSLLLRLNAASLLTVDGTNAAALPLGERFILRIQLSVDNIGILAAHTHTDTHTYTSRVSARKSI